MVELRSMHDIASDEAMLFLRCGIRLCVAGIA